MPPLTDGNWLARAGRVSASEVAALMPEGHPFIDSRDVWERITGVTPQREASDAMRLGTILEPAILAAAADRWGWKVITNAHTYKHRSIPLCATPDARIARRNALVEVKYSGNPTAWQTLPAHVWWQVQAQMMCTGSSYVEVVVLCGRFKRWTVERNLTAARRIGIACRQMIDSVRDGIAPQAATRDRNVLHIHTSDVPESIGASK